MSAADDPVALIGRALQATIAAGTARIQFTTVSRPVQMPASAPSLDVMVPRAVRPLARRIGRGIGRAVMGPKHAEGLIDLRRRLVALDFGAEAELTEGDRRWTGASGRPRPSSSGTPGWDRPLWMLDLLRGVVAAEARGTEPVGGAPCLRLAAVADLILASREAPGPMAVPSAPSYAALGRLRIDCWLDEASLVRRVTIELDEGLHTTALTADFAEFGVPVPQEWPNLPRLRGPARTGRG